MENSKFDIDPLTKILIQLNNQSISFLYLIGIWRRSLSLYPKSKKQDLRQIMMNPGSKKNEEFIYSRIHMEKHISKNEHRNFAHNQGEKLRAIFIKKS